LVTPDDPGSPINAAIDRLESDADFAITKRRAIPDRQRKAPRGGIAGDLGQHELRMRKRVVSHDLPFWRSAGVSHGNRPAGRQTALRRAIESDDLPVIAAWMSSQTGTHFLIGFLYTSVFRMNMRIS
jgi:hypothetical protein